MAEIIPKTRGGGEKEETPIKERLTRIEERLTRIEDILRELKEVIPTGIFDPKPPGGGGGTQDPLDLAMPVTRSESQQGRGRGGRALGRGGPTQRGGRGGRGRGGQGRGGPTTDQPEDSINLRTELQRLLAANELFPEGGVSGQGSPDSFGGGGPQQRFFIGGGGTQDPLGGGGTQYRFGGGGTQDPLGGFGQGGLSLATFFGGDGRRVPARDKPDPPGGGGEGGPPKK